MANCRKNNFIHKTGSK